jgi:hypothetical protein
MFRYFEIRAQSMNYGKVSKSKDIPVTGHGGP